MHVKIPYKQNSEKMLSQLPKGMFLTVKNEDRINTMVIGWGHIGYLWGKEVFVAYVRYSRYTYHLLENAKEFTISVPLNNNLRKELAICGRESGRDIDKFTTCSFTQISGRKINVPIIGECQLHYECKVIYQHPLDEKMLPNDIKERYYKDGDYHMVYYGEIVDSYLYQKK